jgi:UDP-glucose 4-epimerase
MVHVKDVAEALVRALEASHAGHLIPHPVEVGPEVSATVNEVAEQVVASAFIQNVHVPPAEGPTIVHLPMRPGEELGAVVKADTSTLGALGMDPAKLIDLRTGLGDTVKW